MAKHEVVLARVLISGDPVLERQHDGAIRMAAGDTLVVKAGFRMDEISAEEERFKVSLDCGLGGMRPPVAVREMGDRPMAHDRLWGVVEQTFKHVGKGHHTLSFDLEASYSSRSRKAGEAAKERTWRRSLKGTVPVVAS